MPVILNVEASEKVTHDNLTEAQDGSVVPERLMAAEAATVHSSCPSYIIPADIQEGACITGAQVPAPLHPLRFIVNHLWAVKKQ